MRMDLRYSKGIFDWSEKNHLEKFDIRKSLQIKEYCRLGLDSIRTAILNWHFLRIDTQEMHIPSTISILGTDLRGLIPWIIKLKQVKLRRNTEIQINMQIKLTCCCSCYLFSHSAKHGIPRKRCFGMSLSFGRVWWGTDAYWQYKTREILVPHHTFQWTMSHMFF